MRMATIILAAVLGLAFASYEAGKRARPEEPCKWYITDNGNGTPARLVWECK